MEIRERDRETTEREKGRLEGQGDYIEERSREIRERRRGSKTIEREAGILEELEGQGDNIERESGRLEMQMKGQGDC